MAPSPIISWLIKGGKIEAVTDFLFLGSKVIADGDWSHEIRRQLLLGKKTMTNLESALKSKDITLPKKFNIVKAMVFPVVMYGCESWTIKKAEHQRTDAFKLCCWRRLLRVLDSKEIKPVNPKGNQPWILIGRTNAKAETPVFWSPDVNRWLTGKVPDAGKDWGHKEKMVSEDEMAGWHHQCNESELGQTLGDDEGQGDLECWSPRDHKRSDMTGWLKNNINRWARLHYLWAEQRKGQGLLRQAIMYDFNNKSNKMQTKETVSNMESGLASL